GNGQTSADGNSPIWTRFADATTQLPAFRNEALLDFAVEKNRDKMKRALAEVRGQLGRTYRLVVDNKEIETKSSLVSRNPSDTSQIIGTVSAAETQHVNQAVDAAKK